MDRLLIASQINTFSWQRRRKSFFIDTSFTWFTWPTTKWKWRKLDFHTSKVGRNLHQFCCKVHHLVFLNNLVKITAEGILGTLNLKVLKTMMHPTSGPRKRAMISGSTWVLLSKKIVKSPFKSAVESWNAFLTAIFTCRRIQRNKCVHLLYMTKTHISFSHRHPSMFPNRNIRKKKGVHTVPNLDFWSKIQL